MSITNNEYYKSMSSRINSLSSKLPYLDYDKQNKIFIGAQNDLSALYKIELVEHETKNNEQILKHINYLNNIMDQPENVCMQFIFDQEEVLDSLDLKHDIEDVFIKCYNSTVNQINQTKTYRRTLHLSVRYFYKHKDRGLIKSFFKCEKSTLNEINGSLTKEIKNFGEVLKNLENSTILKVSRVGVDQFLELTRKQLNPSSYNEVSKINYRDNESLSEQVLYNDIDAQLGEVVIGDIKNNVLVFKNTPRLVYEGAIVSLLKIDTSFRCVLNISFPSPQSLESFFLMRKKFNASGVQLKEIEEAEKRNHAGDGLKNVTLLINITGSTELELSHKASVLKQSFMDSFDVLLDKEEIYASDLFISMLPNNYNPQIDVISSGIKAHASDIVCMIPIFDSYRGHGKGPSVFVSREKNIIKYGHYNSGNAFHAPIIANTGSGKNTFIEKLIRDEYATDDRPLIFFIEDKSNQKTSSGFVNANYVEFGISKKMPINPFMGPIDAEKYHFVVNYLKMAFRLYNPSYEHTSDIDTVLYKAVKQAYCLKVNEVCEKNNKDGVEITDELMIELTHAIYITFDDIIESVSEVQSAEEDFSDKTYDNIRGMLTPFCGDNVYASQFKTEKNLLGYKDINIFDLSKVRTDKNIQTLMTLAILEYVRQTMSLPRNRGRRAEIIITEIGSIGDNEVATDFIKNGAETFRKLNVSIKAMAPRPSIFFETAAGKALIEVATKYYFLECSGATLELIKENLKFLDDNSIDIISSLRTVPGVSADVFHTDTTLQDCGTLTFKMNPYDYWLSPNNSKADCLLEDTFKSMEQDYQKTLDYLVAEYPGGVQ